MRTSELMGVIGLRFAGYARKQAEMPKGQRLVRLLQVIADRVVIDGIRRRIVERRAKSRLSQHGGPEGAPRDPAEAAERSELRAILAMAVAELPEADRVIVRCRLQGLPWAAAARETGLGEAAIRKRWQALRRRLRARLEGLLEPPAGPAAGPVSGPDPSA